MSTDNLPILIEVLLFGGGAIAFGLWQMRSLKRDRALLQARRAAEAGAEATATARASAPAAGPGTPPPAPGASEPAGR